MLAYEYINNAAPHLNPLAEFLLPRMSEMPLASSSLKTRSALSGPFPLNSAVAKTWLILKSPMWTVAISADCDHADAEEFVDRFMHYMRAADPSAPRPLIVYEPFTRRAHVTWILEREVYTGPQTREGAARSERVLRTLADVQRGICAALGADPNFTNRLTKNPFAQGKATPVEGSQPAAPDIWDCYLEGDGDRPTRRFLTDPGDCHTVSLSTLWRALKLWREDTGMSIPGAQWKRRVNENGMDKGRRLFEFSRVAIYNLGTTDLAVIERVVQEQAAHLSSPTTPGQRDKIARSIWRFMCTNYTGTTVGPKGRNAKRRGVLHLEPTLELRERQARGGRFAAKMTARNNDRRIDDAVSSLKAAGKKLTQAAIAAAAGLSKRTVEKRWPCIKNVAKQCPSGRGQPEQARKAVLLPETGPSSKPAVQSAVCGKIGTATVSIMTVPDAVAHNISFEAKITPRVESYLEGCPQVFGISRERPN